MIYMGHLGAYIRSWDVGAASDILKSGHRKRRLFFERGVRMAMIPTTCYVCLLHLSMGLGNQEALP